MASNMFRIAAVITCLVILAPAKASAVLAADFTEDELLPNTPSMVDAYDYMVWFNYRFTTNAQKRFGDANGDTNVDGSDFAVWNSTRFTKDPSPICSAVCISDTTYRTRMSDPLRNNITFNTDLSAAPTFAVNTITDNGLPSGTPLYKELRISLATNTFLTAFTVTGPAATSFGPKFNGIYLETTPALHIHDAVNGYLDGRQQWVFLDVIGANGLPSSINGVPIVNELVAQFPLSLSDTPGIFYQVEKAGPFETSEIITGTQNVAIPEPSAVLSLGLVAMVISAGTLWKKWR